MELPFYLRILPPEALEVLAYYRRQGSNIAHADTMMSATALSERGFGKAIRRLVTKGYLVLDSEQRYRLTEHGQRAVDDLPASMAGHAENSPYSEPEIADEPEIQRIPVESSDNFDSLFESDSSTPANLDTLFDEPTLVLEDTDEESTETIPEPDEAIPVDAMQFLQPVSPADDDASEPLFGDEDAEDLFAELGNEEAAAFDELFGSGEEDAEPEAEPVTWPPVNEPIADSFTASSDDLFADFEDLFGDIDTANAIEATQTTEHSPEAFTTDNTAAEEESISESLIEHSGELAEGLPSVVVPPTTTPPTDLLDMSMDNVDLFEWLEVDSDSVANEGFDLWGTHTEENDTRRDAVTEEASPAAAPSEQRNLTRRVVVSLPQPLVAEQPAHVTIGILPGSDGSLREPVPLVVRLAVVNGTPAYPNDLPLLLTNGLTRQDTTITPGRYQQVRLRLQVYQMSDDEAILCGGLYLDADVVEDADTQAPVAFGADAHFVLGG